VDHSKASRTYHSLLNPLKSTTSAINQSIDLGLGSTDQSKWGTEVTQEEEKPNTRKRTLGGSVHLKMRLRESVGFHNQVALSKPDRLNSSMGANSLQDEGQSARQSVQMSTAQVPSTAQQQVQLASGQETVRLGSKQSNVSGPSNNQVWEVQV
jgi:hypothetical protein